MQRQSKFLFWLCAGMLCTSAAAQENGFRTELSNGSSGWITLVNLSDKPIEAFHFIGKCSTGKQGAVNELTYDALGNGTPADSGHPAVQSMHPPLLPGQLAFLQDDIAKPHERWYAMVNLIPQSSGCGWDPNVDAVLYADGTYEGNQNAARALQAYRDGLAAGVKYWAERLHSYDSNLAALQFLAADAGRMVADYKKMHMYPACRERPVACAYWNGRLRADGSFSNRWNFELKKDDDREMAFHRATGWIEKWRDKIDADVALEKLEATFPLSPELADTPLPPQQLTPAVR